MRQEHYWNTSQAFNLANEEYAPEDYVRSTSEESRLRALSLYVIRSIVEKHGGTIEEIDLSTYTIGINVPEQEKLACAQEIEEQVGSMCH